MLCVVLEMAAGELDRLHELIAGRFARAEPRARVRAYVSGLVRVWSGRTAGRWPSRPGS